LDQISRKVNLDFFLNKNIILIYIISFIVPMGLNMIAPVLPKIMVELNLKEEEVSLINIFFTMPGIIVTPFIGIIIDRFSSKKLLIISLLVFGISGFLSCFVNYFSILLILRFLQGMSNIFIIIINLIAISDLFDGETLLKVIGINSSMTHLGGIIWPMIGGFLSKGNWRNAFYPFFISLIIALFVYFNLSIKTYKKDYNKIEGYFSKTFSILNNNREIFSLFLIITTSYLIFYGCYITYFPLYINKIFNLSTLFIGFSLSIMRLTALFVSAQISKLKRVFSFKWLFSIAIIFYILSLISIIFIINRKFILLPSIIWGIAHGIFLPCSQIFVIKIAPSSHKGEIISLSRFFTRFGQTIGPLIMGAVLVYYNFQAVFYFGIFLWILVLILLLSKRIMIN